MSKPLSRALLQLPTRSPRLLSPRSTLLRTSQPHYTNPLLPRSIHRPFTSSPSLLKKQKNTKTTHRTDTGPALPSEATPTEQAADLSNVEASILKAIGRLTQELSQLRAGGRFNPELIEGLWVQLGTQATGKQSVKLRDIAQVVPKGRMLNVIVGEKEHIKPVLTAISSSSFSLTPQPPHSDNPLTITVPIPPPTGESRRAVVEVARKAGETADQTIQSARNTHHKMLRKFKIDKSVTPDDLVRAEKDLTEVVKRGHVEVAKIVDTVKKVLESQ